MEKEQSNNEGHLFKNYGGILGTEISPLSIFTARYFEKNYGKSLKAIPESGKILEIGPGSASFVQYLFYKGYRDITVCEAAEDNAQSIDHALGDKIEVINSEAIHYLEGISATFDLIYAGQVIEHFDHENVIRFLKACKNALKSGGFLILETINCANVTHGLYLRYCDYTHRMGFTPRSLMQFLTAIGDFSAINLMEIRPQGFLDCIYYALRRLRKKHIISEIRQEGNVAEKRSSGSGRLIGILLKTLSTRSSRCLSSLLLRHYEFEGIKIYTPFFAVVAQKD